ncbi:MAG: 1,4-alpha-glucan branching protein GlgB [Ruminococcus sp.]|nr:1,4-alpha-glucan branching protein GlgB [Ruminococcus sp.]
MELYDFYTGKSFDAYEFMGAHVKEYGVEFCTFAPGAERISLIGEFSDWNEIPMNKAYDGNFYTCTVPDALEGQMYKYKIYYKGGCTDHCDPYGYGMELRPNSASIIRDLKKYKFSDSKWIEKRNNMIDKPLNIYEVHLGSWKTNEEDENGWYTYSEIADELIEYVTKMGYNAIEFMPLSEYPCDESWGYQGTGFFSPTSRYGTAYELMELIDKCHNNNISVIMDFVPVHFAVDSYALANYDGTHLYEYPNDAVGYSEWGSCNFMHSRGEVCSFLQSAADFWIEKFHFDGIRMDAISRIIYWQGEPARGVNKNAVDFLRHINSGLKHRHSGIILSAEDSTNFADVTVPVQYNGLGFDYKWDMGWMNDTLSYFQSPPSERREKYHKLTFSMMYYYNEHFLLPLSHDENVHGKATIMQKMWGDYDVKFPQARAFYMYMYVHPGKKLNFMGNELGQLREWSENQQQDWMILKYPLHDSFHEYIKELNHIYLNYPALYSGDYARDCFRWIDCHQEDKLIYAIERSCIGQSLAAVFNFDDKEYKKYTFTLEPFCELELIISSDWERFGGNSRESENKIIKADENGNITVNIPAFSGLLYLCRKGERQSKAAKIKKKNVRT